MRLTSMKLTSRHSSILVVGLTGAALAMGAFSAPARAQGPGDARASGVMETSPVGAPVRTYSNGVRVPVPQASPGTVDSTVDTTTTGSIDPAMRRVPDPRTNRNALGCPDIDPLCQGR